MKYKHAFDIMLGLTQYRPKVKYLTFGETEDKI